MANKHRKRCLTSQIIRERKIKTTMTYHLIPIRTAIKTNQKLQKIVNVGVDVEKLTPLCMAGRIMKW